MCKDVLLLVLISGVGDEDNGDNCIIGVGEGDMDWMGVVGLMIVGIFFFFVFWRICVEILFFLGDFLIFGVGDFLMIWMELSFLDR